MTCDEIINLIKKNMFQEDNIYKDCERIVLALKQAGCLKVDNPFMDALKYKVKQAEKQHQRIVDAMGNKDWSIVTCPECGCSYASGGRCACRKESMEKDPIQEIEKRLHETIRFYPEDISSATLNDMKNLLMLVKAYEEYMIADHKSNKIVIEEIKSKIFGDAK